MTVLTYALVVNGPLYGTQSAKSAYQFALALIDKGHKLERIFFYQDGVLNASSLSVPANDEFDLAKAWQTLADMHQVNLESCVAASLRRGIISSGEATTHGLPTSNLLPEFELAGLGSLAQALLEQDRVIQF